VSGTEAVYTVTQLQALVRDHLEAAFHDIWVEGEISRPSFPRSGHCYLTLKDEGATLTAVLWRSTLQRLRFQPEEGLAVRARGQLTVYPPTGRYQMIVRALEPLGAGPLQVRFEQLRRRLEADGLFDPDHKQPLPAFPTRVALVTSPTGAAVRDLIHVAHRRWPALELVVIPVRVQGEGAAEEITAAIRTADGLGFDAIIAGRGGGSLEDLWAFNEEVVARAIFDATTPVVSAVGHEVDVSIADLVADVRAATPSVAAELVTPDRREIEVVLEGRSRRLVLALSRTVAEARRRIDSLREMRVLRDPLAPVREREVELDAVTERLGDALFEGLGARRSQADLLAGRLEALSPLKVLARGYSVTRKGNQVVRAATDVNPGDRIRTTLDEGEISSRVE